jgi:nitrite reductase/ring-hydroxylating ferredoxin subunit
MTEALDIGERATVFDLGRATDVLVDGRAVVTVGPDGTSVLIVETRRGVFAMQNRCPHLGLRLDTAAVRGRRIKCAFHGREYDMRSGACHGSPKPRSHPLATHRAWIHQGYLFLAVTDAAVDGLCSGNQAHDVQPSA